MKRQRARITERENAASASLDTKPTREILRIINREDHRVAPAVGKTIPQIARAVDLAVEAVGRGGRLIYLGAGTSGRLGVLDAAECIPTFGTDRVVAVIAGAPASMFRPVEGAEDDPQRAIRDLRRIKLCRRDLLVGISASGRTPYVLGGMRYAQRLGAKTVGLTSNPDAPLKRLVDVAIVPVVGPEVIAGSSRMKAGTAQKLVLNMLSTATMARLGRVLSNWMIHVQLTNKKLRKRGQAILMKAAGVGPAKAAKTLEESGRNLPVALLMLLRKISREEAHRLLGKQQNVSQVLRATWAEHAQTAGRSPDDSTGYRTQENPMKVIKAILAGTIYTPTNEIENGAILIDGHRITKVGPRDQIKIPAGATVIDNHDRIVVPGFIDMHIHGAMGHDLMEATPEAVTALSTYLPRHGTTAYLATTVTASLERTLHAAQGLSEIIHASLSAHGESDKLPGAQPVGIHFEGPFLNVKKRGAHPVSQIRKPSVETTARFLDAAGNTARMLTLAPEMEGALTVLEYARSRGIRVAMGHSNATCEEAERAIAAGATHAVHVYNAMRPFAHRDSGIIGAVLTDDRVTAELICDGVHVEPTAIRLLVKAKGIERVVLVSDSSSGAGMPDGNYRLGNFTVHVAGGVCRTVEGNLAGSTITLDAALRNLASFTGLSYQTCLPCATLNPARILGLEKQKGVIAPGADADLAILDQSYYVTQTYVRGHPVL